MRYTVSIIFALTLVVYFVVDASARRGGNLYRIKGASAPFIRS